MPKVNLGKLSDLLRTIEFTGTLDGKPFAEISKNGIGSNALVLKGWLDTEAGPTVRLRAGWSELVSILQGDTGDVVVRYQKDAKMVDEGTWLDTEEAAATIERDGNGLKLSLPFGIDEGTSGSSHVVEFTAHIGLGELVDKLL